MGVLRWIEAVAATATAIGVFLAWWQILLAKRQSATQFEDQISAQYRELAQSLPIEALLGEQISEEQYRQSLPQFYHYIDLSNEQIFLRQQGRIRLSTWKNWADGIRGNLSRPAFRRAWQEIKNRAPDSFDELRQLEATGFNSDPRGWKKMARIPHDLSPDNDALQLTGVSVGGS